LSTRSFSPSRSWVVFEARFAQSPARSSPAMQKKQKKQKKRFRRTRDDQLWSSHGRTVGDRVAYDAVRRRSLYLCSKNFHALSKRRARALKATRWTNLVAKTPSFSSTYRTNPPPGSESFRRHLDFPRVRPVEAFPAFCNY
ncbi:unnamed protein product, partial [Scytosiphon promiscuus]